MPTITDGRNTGPDGDLPREPPRDLPPLAGGWDLFEGTYGATSVGLWIPRAPDTLLDDAGVVERNRFNDSMPYWAWVWDSAPRLARLVAASGWASGTRVLELGAGLGLVGFVAARLGCEVTLSDHDPLALATLRVNARECAPDSVGACVSTPRVLDLDWRALDVLGDAQFDAILGCDVLYESGAHEPVLELLERCLAPQGEAWFADPGRTRLPAFLRRAEARGFRVVVLDEGGHPSSLDPGAFRVVQLVSARPGA